MIWHEHLTRDDLARVNVVGTSGSGKSTFSKAFARKLGHPRVEMDALFWNPGWTQSPDEVFFARLESALARDAWVLDGNYDRTLHIKWRSATAVIWIDYSFARTLFQAVRRALGRAISKEELWPGTGNRESFRKTLFSRESIILWMIRSHPRLRERYEARAADPRFAHLKFVRLRSPKEAARFLASVR